MINREGQIGTQGEAALASIYGGVSPVYFAGDWLALARNPPVPPRSAQQSWAALALSDNRRRLPPSPARPRRVGSRGICPRRTVAGGFGEAARSAGAGVGGVGAECEANPPRVPIMMNSRLALCARVLPEVSTAIPTTFSGGQH